MSPHQSVNNILLMFLIVGTTKGFESDLPIILCHDSVPFRGTRVDFSGRMEDDGQSQHRGIDLFELMSIHRHPPFTFVAALSDHNLC